MIVLGLDFEATGVDPKTARVFEIGAVLHDTEVKAPVRVLNVLVRQDAPIPPDVKELTHVSDEMVAKFGYGHKQAFTALGQLAEKADALVAHNGLRYDFELWGHENQRLDEALRFKLGHLVRVDTTIDVNYPDRIKTRQLLHLAAEHGIINPFAHRALPDVLTMLRVADCYDWEETVANARSPMIEVQSLVSMGDRQLAKDAGFFWDPDRKMWTKSMRQSRLEYARKGWKFQVRITEQQPASSLTSPAPAEA